MSKIFSVLLVLVMIVSMAAFSSGSLASEDEAVELVLKNRSKMYSKDVQKTVDAGLAYLAEAQNADGSWGSTHKMANTAMAGLAFLAAGNSTSRGEYSKVVRSAVEFFLETQNKTNGYYFDQQSRVHGHGFAMLFMAQACGMSSTNSRTSKDKLVREIQESLQKAADLTVASQASCGGWPYNLSGQKGGDHEGSTTVCAAEGLRAARDIGIHVDKESIDLGLDYMKKTYGNGSFAYRYPQKGGNSLALSAAGAVVLISYGDQSKEIQDMISECVKFMKDNSMGGSGMRTGFTFYMAFYATQAFHYVGGKDWENWYDNMKKQLLSTKIANSKNQAYWAQSETQDPAFSTGIALMILQMPNEYLPIFQK